MPDIYVLDLEIGEVKEFFKREEDIDRILDMLCKVGLYYIKFGQSAATLSGGEAQRIKLAKELCDGKTEGTMYLLDELSDYIIEMGPEGGERGGYVLKEGWLK
ncbi:MAG: hypothetical protein PHC91_04945 [Eubacteriales bacterium]|nr:hypothetical protein [Eubacteriales bacterium]